MDSTKLRLEYALRSWGYEWPDPLENALEEDYVKNRHLYAGKKTFQTIELKLTIEPETTPNEMLKFVRALHKQSEMTFKE